MTILKGLQPFIEDCIDCPLSKDGGPENPVIGIGNANPKFIVVGEGPGWSDIQQQMPFSGKAGQLLQKALQQAGVSRDDIYVTNTTLCQAGTGEQKDERVEKAAQCCSRRLKKELELVPDVPILALGRFAASAMLEEKIKITEISGSLFDKGGRYVIPSVHPAAIDRGALDKGVGGARSSDLMFWSLIYDVTKVARLAEGSIKPLEETVWITTVAVECNTALSSIFAKADETKILAIDLETLGVTPEECLETKIKDVSSLVGSGPCLHCEGHSALETMHAVIQALGLATFNHVPVAVLWEQVNEGNKIKFKELLLDPTVEKIFHNRGYDEIVLERNGFPVRGPIHCTLLMHHAGFPGFPHKLQRVASQFYVTRAWKSEFRSHKDKKIIGDLLRYNALDVGRTYLIKAPLVKRMVDAKTLSVYDIDTKKAEIGKHMQFVGMPVDMERNQVYHEYFLPKLREHRDALGKAIIDEEFKKNFLESIATERAKRQRKADPDSFEERQKTRLQEIEDEFEELNLDAKDHVIGYLRACGVPLTKFTKKGGVSTSKDVLEELVKFPPVRHLLEYRKLNKLFDTFIEPLPYKLISSKFGPRLHAIWKQTIISGRFSTSPNVQNWSKGEVSKKDSYDKWLLRKDCIPNLRWMVKPIKGRVLVGGDFKALEARNIGRRAEDKYLCDVFSADRDIHTELCIEMYKDLFTSLPLDDGQRVRMRDVMKRIEYAYFYGAAAATAWQQLVKEGIDTPFSDVVEIFQFLAKKAPSVALYHRTLKGKVFKEKALRSFLYNRARFFPLGFGEETIIKNFEPQADAADICDTALVKLYSRLPEFNDMFIIQQGHDALVVEVWEDDAERAKAVLKECMEQEYEGMRYTVEIDIGTDWGSV